MARVRFLLRFVALMALSGGAVADVALVAAAADLNFAMREIAVAFQRDSGRQMKLSFGSSGTFRHQIAAGAPFQLFMSADEDYVLALHREGRTLDAGTLYAVGRIVLFAPNRSPLVPDEQMSDLRRLLAAGAAGRFAIANPAHAPYGRAAREALERLGLWEGVQRRLVLGENASQATQFSATADALGGIIPLSLVRAPEIARLGRFALLPEDLHAPLRQRMALLRGAGAGAQELYRYLQSAPARAVLRRYGFLLPGE